MVLVGSLGVGPVSDPLGQSSRWGVFGVDDTDGASGLQVRVAPGQGGRHGFKPEASVPVRRRDAPAKFVGTERRLDRSPEIEDADNPGENSGGPQPDGPFPCPSACQ